MSVVSLTDAGVSGIEVARVFGLSAEYVSRLRSRAKLSGSVGLVRPRGRNRKLSGSEVDRVCKLARTGSSQAEIAYLLNVSQPTISRVLAAIPALPERLHLPLGDEATEKQSQASEDEELNPIPDPVTLIDEDQVLLPEQDTEISKPVNIARIENAAEVSSCYAGAMLLYHFFSRLGVEEVLSSLPRVAARRYDAPSMILAATFGFALGSSSMEGTKHLHRIDAGALIGLASFPELRTLRPRLADIAEASDPFSLQRSFAKAMLAADEQPPELYFCDDHFVTYTGARTLAKGYNTRKGRPERGRDDTFVVDEHWRAICFSSSEPKGLSVNLPPVIDQLIEISAGHPIMVGFDRGGSYPKVFSALREREVDWITYRRAPLVPPTVTPEIYLVEVDAKYLSYNIADEIVEVNGYGQARQLSLHQGDRVVFQILTSDNESNGVDLLRALRARWRIENTFKYAEEHHGIHWLCSYEMEELPDDTVINNPVRLKARSEYKTAEAALARAKELLGAEVASPSIGSSPIDDHETVIAELKAFVATATDDLEKAKLALVGIPARLPRNEIHPGLTREKPRLERRALQMVCRLLAYNAELDLARRINVYLGDDDEYRGITRNLLHLGGTITFTPKVVTVNLNQPDPPRLARALGLLIEEINHKSPRLPGDGRPIVYALKAKTN
jgi:transposase